MQEWQAGGSFHDKLRLLNFLPATRNLNVLDVGAGGADFAHYLTEQGHTVDTLDINVDAIARIKQQYPHISAHNIYAHETHTLNKKYDVIVASSVLHEVFSYGDPHSEGYGSYSAIERALSSFYDSLTGGGALLIRDGVLAPDWQATTYLKLLTPNHQEVVETYLSECPYTTMDDIRNITVNHVEGNLYKGNAKSIMEFAYTYTWGVETFPREAKETYGVETLNGYVKLLEDKGFTVKHAESYLQEGYVPHLNKKMKLYDNSMVSREWFDTNAIWVATKQ